MKKVLSTMLATLMVVAMFTMGAGAKSVLDADHAGLTADEFTVTTAPAQEITVTVTEVTHKYSVDLVFNNIDLEVGGAVWNTQNMKYDFDGSGDTTSKVKIANRSDLSVFAYATVEKVNTDDGITVTSAKDSTTNYIEIAKAIPGVGASNGTATEDAIDISVTSADWATTVNYYAKKGLDTPHVIANVTVVLAKNSTFTD